MFIFTAKLHRGRIAAVLTAAVVVCGAAVGLRLSSNDAAAAASTVSSKGVKSNEDRIAYLASYGWSVKEDPVSVEELILPETFDDTYTQYLELQTGQGFDLAQYCGKRVKRYTYEITNYPTEEAGIQADLLIYKNTVIGGDVLSSQIDGFIHGLAQPPGTKNAALS